jgi:nucleotide-binding universal stress UspA family protein
VAVYPLGQPAGSAAAVTRGATGGSMQGTFCPSADSRLGPDWNRGERGAAMNIAHGKPRIVVGVDESPASLAALRWAAREAGLRATRLQVVQAWERARWRVAPYASCVRLRGTDEDWAAAGARLEGAVRTMLGPASAIPVTVEVAEGLATQVLLDRAAGAELLVLGGVASTGRDAIGPVARDCLRHPPCPIVVVSWERADVPVPV